MSNETSHPSSHAEEKLHSAAAEDTSLPENSEATSGQLFYENPNFRVRVTPQTAGKVLFEIECSPEQTKKLNTAAVDEVRRHVVLPGFRKGKAPKEHVLNCYSSSIEEEWRRLLREQALNFAISSSGYSPLMETRRLRADVEIGDANVPSFIRCACDAMPPMPAIDLEIIRGQLPEREAHVVTQEDQDQALHRLRSFYATRQEVDRPAQLGDCLYIEAINPEQGKLLKERHWNGIELDQKAIETPWVAQLVGAKVGDEKTCFPREEIDKAGNDPLYLEESSNVPVKITRIEEMHLAPVDQSLAEKAGCKSVEELLERIKINLSQHAFYNLLQQRTADLKTALLAQYPIVMPPALVRGQYEMHRPLIDAANIPKEHIEERHALEQTRAREFLHMAHLLNKWTTDHKIPILNEDLEREYQHQMAQNELSDRFIHDGMTPEIMRRQLLLLAVIRNGLHDILLRLFPDLGKVSF